MAIQPSSKRTGWRSTVWGELSAEFVGTFILIAFGDGVVAMAVAALNQSGRGQLIFAASGDWLLIAWGWALAVAFAVYVAGGISGAHINPAVTLAFAVKRGFPWRKVPGYVIAQTLGAFAGAALVYLNYHDAIASYERANDIARGAANSTPTFSIFATFPAPYYTSNVGPLIDQVIGTAFLVLFVFALVDTLPTAKVQSRPAFGGTRGGRDRDVLRRQRRVRDKPSPRLWSPGFCVAHGWGGVALPGVHNYFWVPIVGPLIGGVIGALVYDFFIRHVLVARGERPEPDVESEGRTVE